MADKEKKAQDKAQQKATPGGEGNPNLSGKAQELPADQGQVAGQTAVPGGDQQQAPQAGGEMGFNPANPTYVAGQTPTFEATATAGMPQPRDEEEAKKMAEEKGATLEKAPIRQGHDPAQNR